MSKLENVNDKQSMLAYIADSLKQFLALLDQLSDEQMLQAVDSAGWNVRDHLTHLAVWADGVAALLRREDRWQAMGVPDPGKQVDFDIINQQIVEQHRDMSPAAAREWLLAAHERVVAAVESLPEAQLANPYERFVAPFSGDGGRPIYASILGNTAGHYNEHAPWIRAIAGKPDQA